MFTSLRAEISHVLTKNMGTSDGDLCSQGMCLFTILIAAKGSGIAQLRYKKREKAVSWPFPGRGWGISRETHN